MNHHYPNPVPVAENVHQTPLPPWRICLLLTLLLVMEMMVKTATVLVHWAVAIAMHTGVFVLWVVALLRVSLRILNG